MDAHVSHCPFARPARRAFARQDFIRNTQAEGTHFVAKQRKTATKPARRKDKKGGPGSGRRKPCPYCKDKIEQVDYKNVGDLRRFVSERGKIRSRRITGACRRHQSQIATAVKRARELALLPYAAEPASESVGGRRGRDRDRERE